MKTNIEVVQGWARQDQESYKGGTIYSTGQVLYSYGRHFPLAIITNEQGVIYKNSSSYSNTTSKHKSLISNRFECIIELSNELMKRLDNLEQDQEWGALKVDCCNEIKERIVALHKKIDRARSEKKKGAYRSCIEDNLLQLAQMNEM